MLLSLKIENYTLIKSCNIDFQEGFTAITGETGAGKSILLGALSLVMGSRADMQVILDKDKKCIVEAVFEIDKSLKPLFIDNNLDYDNKSIFRREITPNGKSRAFINDTPVSINIMRMFSEYFVDIHSQSSTVKLKDNKFQLSVIDAIIENHSLIDNYKDLYKQYIDVTKHIEAKKQLQSDFLKELSYNTFLYNELEQAKLQKEEQQEEEQRLELIQNAEQIKENLNLTLQNFDNEQVSLLSLLNDSINYLSKISNHNDILKSLYNRLSSSNIELKDIYMELSSFAENIDFDTSELDKLNERLNIIYSLQKKHNVNTIAELLTIQSNLAVKIQASDDIASEIQDLEKQKQKILKDLTSVADNLHIQRVKAGENLSKKVKPLLNSMAMKEAHLAVQIKETEDFTPYGKDSVTFLFNANKTPDNKLMEMSNVISGGELSRLMLAIKAVSINRLHVHQTMVFDEIDTGISGDIASKAADIMLQIAENYQVIAITHLVQMAAKAQYQYKVYKKVINNQAESNIKSLTYDERINELAKMLSSDKVTKEALANAKTLLE